MNSSIKLAYVFGIVAFAALPTAQAGSSGSLSVSLTILPTCSTVGVNLHELQRLQCSPGVVYEMARERVSISELHAWERAELGLPAAVTSHRSSQGVEQIRISY